MSSGGTFQRLARPIRHRNADREQNTHIRLGLVEDEQTLAALVEHAVEDLVEDHLRQFELDRLPPLPDLLRDVLDLDDRVRLDDAEEVLLEQRVVQRGEMCPDRGVGRELWWNAK